MKKIFDLSKNILKLLLWAAAVVAISATIFLLIFITINRTDEPLEQEAKLAIDWKPAPNYINDNGFLILLGQNAPESTDAYEAGKMILKAQLKLYDDRRPDSEWEALREQLPPSKDDWQEQRCDYKKQNCVNHYLQTRQLMKTIIKRSALQEKRFAKIVHLQNFVDVVFPIMTAPTPSWRYLSTAAELIRVKAIYEIEDGQKQIGVMRLVENAQFSRRLLEQSGTWPGHMTALKMIRNDMRIVSELIQIYPELAHIYGQALLKIAKPISANQFSMKRALIAEQMFVNNIIPQIKIPPGGGVISWMFAILFQPNATVNLRYVEQNGLALVTDASADKLDAVKLKVKQKHLEAMGHQFFGLFYFKNPVGKLGVDPNHPDGITRYVEGQHDTDGYIRLVALQIKIASANIPIAKIAEVVNSATEEFRNPYTNSPMQWDEKTQKIYFQGRQPAKENWDGSSLFAIKIK